MRDAFTSTRILSDIPRLYLEGSTDLTHRCNNRYRHYRIGSGETDGERAEDLVFGTVHQSRSTGRSDWGLSGGDPWKRGASSELTAQRIGAGAFSPFRPKSVPTKSYQWMTGTRRYLE